MRELFEEYLDAVLANVKGSYIDVEAKDVHSSVGRYPGKNHRMPICCDVMYKKMKIGDAVLYAPPKGKGATLKIRYYNNAKE